MWCAATFMPRKYTAGLVMMKWGGVSVVKND